MRPRRAVGPASRKAPWRGPPCSGCHWLRAVSAAAPGFSGHSEIRATLCRHGRERLGSLTELLVLCCVLGIVRLGAALGTAVEVSAAALTSQDSFSPGPRDDRRPPPLFGIGRGEKDAHTHVAFETPKGLVSASVHVVVDRTASAGLNFFALQVDFNNGTWAHGGVQDVDRAGGTAGQRLRQVNWGGLVDRGGGYADYDLMDDRADLEKIQNPAVGQQLGPYPWKNGVEYEYLVERGALVTLPPGTYRLSWDRQPVHLGHARRMWEWRLTIRPVSEPGAPFVAVLYDGADALDSVSVWNESGYGSTDQAQHTSWRQPLCRALGGSRAQAPRAWKRF
jgi:hypothetical protein